MNSLDAKPTTCSCQTCQKMCERRACWATPDDARRLIQAGYGDRLWRDYWAALPNIYNLSPAAAGFEGKEAPFHPDGRCTFLTDDGLCELHELGLKPTEGRLASCQDFDYRLHEAVAKTWDNPEAQEFANSFFQKDEK